MLWNDFDPEGSSLSISSVTAPQHGSASPQFDYNAGANVVAYTPTSAYTGSDGFNYTISDGMATASASATLTVHPVDNTIATARPLTLQDNVRLTAGGIIGDGPQSWSDVDMFSVSLTAGQVIKFDIDSAKIDAGGSYGSLNALLRLFNSSGTQVAVNDNGTDPDTGIASNDPYLTYTVTTSGTYYLGVSESSNSSYNPTSSGGGYSMMTGAYLLQVLREVPNQPPVATADTASTHFSTPVTIPVLANDTDPNGDALTLTTAGTPSHGTTQIVTVNGTSQIRYTPTVGYVGSDSFTYTISDPFGATATGTVSVSVTNSNPVTQGDSYEAVAGVSRVVAASGVLANDTDADGDALTAVLVTGVAHGTLTLSANGSFTYLATSGYLGTDSFVYRASDGAGNSDDTTVSISVYPTNVTAFADSYSIGHDKTLTVATPGVLANDWDFEHQTLSTLLVTSTTHGTLTLNANGSFVYVPAAAYVGSDSFVYKATDGTNESAAITVPISVTNFAPWSVNDYYTVSHDRVLSRTAINGLLANDVDVEGDLLTVSLVTGPGTGTLALNANGSFEYTPVAGATGILSFVYRISDGFNFSQNATVSISVVNSPPSPTADLLSTPSGQALSISLATLLSNDVDADGDTMTLAIQSSTSHGTLTTQPDGSLLYQPGAGFSGTDSFHYTLTDGLATSAPVEVRIRVNNAAPLGIADFYSVRHDRPLVVTTNSVVANDIDDDGDTLTVVLESAPSTGTLVLNTDGTFVYTPAAAYVGDVTFTYRVTDGIVTSSPITATIRVTNAAPVVRADAFNVHQGQTLVVPAATGVLQNDSDADSDTLTVSLQNSPTHGTLNLAADGSFTYTPVAGFAGSDNFTYRVSDGILTSAQVLVFLTVSNIRPSATANSYFVLHDQMLVVPAATGVVANDFDIDGDSLTAAVVTGPAHGSLVLQPDGSFSYTPNAGYVGGDTFVYRVSDGAAFSDSVTVTINVTNRRPWSVNRSFAVLHDHSLVVDAPGLFAFSGDGDSDILTIVAGVDPTHGTVTINANGSFTYVPVAGYVGTDSFGYRISDGVSLSDVSLVSIQVFNSAPLATADYYTVSHDRPLTIGTTLGVLANDRDLNSDPLSVTVVAGHGVQHGTLTLNSNGSFSYTPTAGYVGTDTFRYRVTDGAQTADADVTITVINQRPIATNDKYGATVEQVLNVSAANGVLFNDSDADLDVLQAVLVSGTSHGTLTLNSNGSFSYTPAAGFIGVDEFRYEAKDPLNLKSFVATVSISTALVATIDQYTVSHDRVLAGNVEANDFTVSGSAPNYVLLSTPASGTLAFNANGTFTYTPVAGYVGQQIFTYQFSANGNDSNITTATIDVVNEAPLVFTGTWRASHGKTITASTADGLAFRSRDRDGDAMTYSVVTQPTHGTLTLQTNGSFTYVPSDSAYTGSDSFTWKAFDGLAYSEVKTAYIELLNHKAIVTADSYTVHSGNTLTVTAENGVLSNDYDSDNDTLQAEVTVQPTHGTVTLAADGSFVYTPDVGKINETDSLSYRVFDGAQYSADGTLSVRIGNAIPQVLPEQYSVQHDRLLTVLADRGLLANDYDGDHDPLTAVMAVQPQHGAVTLNADGSFTFMPGAGYVGTDSFTYRVSDGIQQSDPVTVSLTITNKNPIANNDQFITRRNTNLVIAQADVTGNDSDADGDTITLLPFGTPGNGTLTASGNGEWTYHPNVDFVGPDTISYQISGGISSSAVASIQINVLNSAPVAAGDRFEVRHDVAFVVAAGRLQTNDFDLEGDALTVSVVDNVRNGTLTMQSTGAFTYTPNAGFTGRDTFSYRLYDGNLYSDPVRVILDVVNNRPTTRDGSHRMTHDTVLIQPASSGLLAGARDVDGDTLTAVVVSTVRNGTLTVQPNGSWTYTPTTHFVGTDSFTYRVSDGALQSLTKTITIEVSNTPVVASMDAYTVTPNTPLNVAAPGVLQNDSDIDGDPLTLTVVDNVVHGTLSLQQNGSFVYTPNAGYIGQDSFTYKVSDGLEDATATVRLTVIGIPQTTQTIPVSRNDYYSTPHSRLLTVSASAGLLGNDRDPNNDLLTVQLVASPGHGTLTLNSSGTFSFVPAAGYSGTDSFTYKVADQIGNSPTATVSIDVTNERPTAYDLEFKTQHGQVYNGTGRGVLAGAADQDNDTLTAQLVTAAAHGTVVVNSNGTFTYTPTAGYAGNDQFVFRVNDGATNSYDAVARLTVGNQAPVASDGYQSTHHDKPAVIELNAFDSDGDSLVYELVAVPQHGTLTYENLINSGSNGQPIRFTGKVTFHPTAGFVGDDEFQYRVNDGVTNSNPAKVSLNVRNFAPKAAPSLQRTTPGKAIIVTGTGLLATASDPDGDTLTLSIVTQPAHGMLTLVQSNGVYTGGYTYTPTAGYAGPDLFTWRVSDGATVSETVTVTIDVQNNVPTIADRPFMQRYREASVNGSGQRTYTVNLATAGIAMDADKDVLQYEIVTNGQHGTATLTAQGVLSWTSTSSTYVGNDTIAVRVTDGYSFSDNAAITIAVDNTKPTAAGDFYSVHHNGTVNITAEKLLRNDFDFDGDTLHIVSITNGAHGTLTQSGDNWTFNPQGWAGTTELTYIVSDGLVNSEPATIEIEVTNAPVWGIDRSFTLTENSSIVFEISPAAGNVWSPDGDAVTVSSSAQPTNGTLTALGNNRWKYTPTPAVYSGGNSSQYGNTARGFIGRDSFVLHLSDGVVQSPPITYSFLVIDPLATTAASYANDESIVASSEPKMLMSAAPDPLWTPSEAAVLPNAALKLHHTRPGKTDDGALDLRPGETISVWDGQSWIVVDSTKTVFLVEGGQIQVSPNGAYSITSPPSAVSGTTQARIRVMSGTWTSETLVKSQYINHAPVVGSFTTWGIVAVTVVTPEDEYPLLTGTITGSMMTYSRDADGDAIHFSPDAGSDQIVSNSIGTIRIRYDGSYEYFPSSTVLEGSATGTFVFQAYDEFGATTTATVSITAGNERQLPGFAPPPDQVDPPSAGGVDGPFYFAPVPVGPTGASDGGHPSLSFGQIGSWLGTFGQIVGIDQSGAYYSIYPGMEEAFLANGGEPSMFSYKVTNSIGSFDIGTIRIRRKVISSGQSVSNNMSTVNCGLGSLAVVFGQDIYTQGFLPVFRSAS